MNSVVAKLYNACPVSFQNLMLTAYSTRLDRERYGGRFRDYQALMSKTERYSEGDLLDYQDEMLRKLVKHAYETVQHYRIVFDRLKLKPVDISTREDLIKLPVLTKQEIKANFKQFISSAFPPKSLKTGHTSGTTGAPLEICYDSATVWATYAVLDRHYRWAGSRLARDGDRIAVLRGNVIVPLDQKAPPFWRHNRFHNQLLLSSFHLSPEDLPLYLEAMLKFKAVVLDGYPSTLYVLAKFLRNIGQKFPLKAVVSSSETLYDFQRELIEDRFQCRVFDYYALAERVAFAAECEAHCGHHFAMEYGIVEILDKQNLPLADGVPGRLVGTSLHNLAMPLIRYATDDVTAIKPISCSCGRAMKLMENVATKAEDTLTLRDGRLVSPSVLTHPFKPLKGVEASQIIQKDYDHIEVKIIRGKGYTDADTRSLKGALKERLGQDVSIELIFVDSLPRGDNGKFRWVVSEVPLGL